ncbi:MAG: DUF4372 domain-containing protein [Prevotella sp.]|nr:DUF4372 domain-containing protein [Prevotella sp.]
MFQDKFIFAQLTSFLDRNHFNYLVRKYDGDRYVKSFTRWNHSWHSCSDNSVIVKVCVMLLLRWRLTNPSVTTLAWGVIL